MEDHQECCLFVVLIIAMTSPAVFSQSDATNKSRYAPTPGTFKRLDSPSDKTIDQLITDALGGIDVASNKILAPGAYVLAELDMYLSQEQFLKLYEPPSNHILRGPDGRIIRNTPASSQPPSPPGYNGPTPTRSKRKAIRTVALRWPAGEIPYQLAPGDFTAKERYLIQQSMTEWERYTCIKFRRASSGDTNLVRIQNGEGCNSQVGMVGGVQVLNLDIGGCRFKGLYLHELGHVIGLVHEHQLPDRDHYIDILMQNVAPHFRIFFNKYSTTYVNQFHVPYEYSSVMHYGTTAFSYNGRAQTIRARDPSKEASIGKVYLKELSFSDVKVVSEMYSCSAFCPGVVTCINNGYLDQNCNCVCPDGSKDCEIKHEPSPSPDENKGDDGKDEDDKSKKDKVDDVPEEPCENNYDNWKCTVWASQGECERNHRYMHTNCRKACGLCDKQRLDEANNHFTTWAWQWFGMFTNLFPLEWMIGVCKDVYTFEKCHKWKQQGDCVTNAKWMKDNCKMTCNFCGNPALRSESNCRNYKSDDQCDRWARSGECILNEEWMKDHCQRSCDACTDTMKDVGEEEDEKEDEEEEETACFDKHDSVQCGKWAVHGECSVNPTWMIANCRMSCAKCDDGTCKNLYDDTQCEVWAQEVECINNREWMHKNCGKTCGVCVSNDSDNGNLPDVDTETETGTGTGTGTDTDNGGVVTRRPDVTRRPTVRTTQPPDTDTCFNTHNDVECNTWAKTGHCDINPQWMHKQCMKACEKCPKDGDGSPDELCRDVNPGCAGWANHGFCDSNPRYNLIYCKKSCDNCNGCRDEQFLCRVWAKAGHCKSNAGYMMRECQRSCATCQ